MGSLSWPGLARLALALFLFLPVFAGQAAAQGATETQAQRQQTQPLNNAPVWRDVRSGKEEYTSVKGRETGVLVQTYGQTWRQLRNGPIIVYGGWLLVAILAVLAVFYLVRGQIRFHEKPTGRLLERFTLLDRWLHWTVAITFCVLAVTGLIIMFGKYIVLPVIGYTLFAWLSQLSKNLHNFVGPLFLVSALSMAVMFFKDNLPKLHDLKWVLNLGGVLRGDNVPAGRFNAFEKTYFWIGLVVLTIVLGVTGLILDFPNFDQTRESMIQANVVHAIAAVIYMAFAMGHIYLGTVGVEGAYEGMRYGYVDETYARGHNGIWYEEVKSGKIKAGTAAGSPEAPQVQVQH